jgi:hypothetical protein
MINDYAITMVEYFKFEGDFVENNLRCIPMIVRFKLDAAGIKLKLAEWSRFRKEERNMLAQECCETEGEIETYRTYLMMLIRLRAGNEPTLLKIEKYPAWSQLQKVEPALQEKAREYNWHISVEQWQALSDLQRFALLKLYRPGHENRNFPKAMIEFGLFRSMVK